MVPAAIFEDFAAVAAVFFAGAVKRKPVGRFAGRDTVGFNDCAAA